MSTLKKNLRFSGLMRAELAESIVREKNITAQVVIDTKMQELAAKVYIKAGWAAGMHAYFDWLENEQGDVAKEDADILVKELLPRTRFISIMHDEFPFHIDLGEIAPVPFKLYSDPESYFKRHLEEFRDELIDLVLLTRDHEMQERVAFDNLMKFLSKTSSPAKAALALPELAMYFPNEWKEESDDLSLTLDEVICNAA